MPKKDIHSLAYRVWNQTRLAHHVDSYFQIYDEIAAAREQDGAFPKPIDETLVRIWHGLYPTMIVQLDMINPNQGVSLCSLIEEARDVSKIDAPTAKRLKAQLDKHGTVLKNIGRQRNNLVAHRSQKHTFAEIRREFPVTIDNLRGLVETYYAVAAELYSYVPFQKIWNKKDERTGARVMIKALRALNP